jgi:voltage-gated potassium channel
MVERPTPSVTDQTPPPASSEAKARRVRPGPYQLFMLAVSVYVVAALAVRVVTPLPAGWGRALWMIDTGLCVVLFADFVRTFVRAESKWRYMRTWGWLDLLSCVPAVEWFRWARLARVVRLVLMLWRLDGVRELTRELVRRRGETAFYSVSLVSGAVVLVGTLSILHFERDVGSASIQAPGDALWWTLVTMSTVGYGDFYPLTLGGRAVAVALMICGIGLFGTFTGLLATWFAGRQEPAVDHAAELRREVAELRAMLERRLPAGGGAEPAEPRGG